ncbi:hypothetical protein SEUCBS139899_007904 [Sporothrix eucalyptigena]
MSLAKGHQVASSDQELQPASPNLLSGNSLQATPIAVNEEDDVFATAAGDKVKGKEKAVVGEELKDPSPGSSGQQEDGKQDTSVFSSFPAMKSTKSTMTLKGRSLNGLASTPSERTLKLIKSSWKSTENLFAKFRAQEQGTGAVPVVPSLPADGLRPSSHRRPSKSVRFSDENPRTEDVISSEPDHDEGDIIEAQDQQPIDYFPIPENPWQYTREYLLEKIKAEKEGRQCALLPPPPEWFAEIDGIPSRQSIFATGFGRDAITKFVSNVSGSSSGRTQSLMRVVSGDSNASVRTTSSTNEPCKQVLQDMAGPQQVAVEA